MEKSIKQAAASHILQTPSRKDQKLSNSTKDLITRRNSLMQKSSRTPIENSNLKRMNQQIKSQSKLDIKEFNKKYVMNVMQNNKSITKANEMATNHGKNWILSLETNSKNATNRVEINEVATAYYEGLFNSSCSSNWSLEMSSTTDENNAFL